MGQEEDPRRGAGHPFHGFSDEEEDTDEDTEEAEETLGGQPDAETERLGKDRGLLTQGIHTKM